MYTKLLLLAIVLFGIWAEYEEMTKVLESPEKEAESLQVVATGSELYIQHSNSNSMYANSNVFFSNFFYISDFDALPLVV